MAEPMTEKPHKFASLSAVGFVIVGIAFWYVFVVLASRVASCAAAARWPWSPECTPSSGGTQALIVILATLPFALWASARIFFPPED